MRNIFFIILSAIFAVSVVFLKPAVAEPETRVDALAGQWTGSLTLGPKEYSVVLWFEGGEPTQGRIQLVGVTSDQNPLSDISVSGDEVSFALASRPPQRFRGTMHGDAMSGTVDIGGVTETFAVQKMSP